MFNVLFMLQHLFPSSARIQGLRDDVRRRIAEHLRREGAGRVIPVERVARLSPDEFRRRHLATGTPVIIDEAAAEWTCTREWSFESFKRRFGAATLKLVHHKGLSDDDHLAFDQEYTEELNFGEFLEQVQSGTTMKYMRFSPILEQFPELLQDFDKQFLQEMPGRMSLGTTFEAFIGGKKSFTPLHNAPTPFFFVNVCGVKRWAMIPNHYLALLNPAADGMSYNHSGADVRSPDAEAFPGFESVDRFEAVMRPGDVMYMPSWLWHSVQNEEPTIGVRCGFMYPKSMMTESYTLFLIRTFAARNPTLAEVLYYTLIKTNLPARKNMLLQPKMYWNYPSVQRLLEGLQGRAAGTAPRAQQS